MKNILYTFAFIVISGLLPLQAQDVSLTNTLLDPPITGQQYGKACFTIIAEDGIELTTLPLSVEISMSQLKFEEDNVYGFNSENFTYEIDPFSPSVLKATLQSTIQDVDNGGGGAQICIPVFNSDYAHPRNGFTVNIVPGDIEQNGSTSNDYIERFGFSQGNQNSFNTSGNASLDANIAKVTNENIELAVSPNPASDQLNVFASNLAENSTLIVKNTIGQLMYHNTNFIYTEKIQLDSWTAGMYIVELRDNNNHLINTKKIMVIK